MSFKIDEAQASKLEELRKAGLSEKAMAEADRIMKEAGYNPGEDADRMAYDLQELMASDVGKLATEIANKTFDHIEGIVKDSWLDKYGYESLDDCDSRDHQIELIEYIVQANVAVAAAMGFEVGSRRFVGYPDEVFEHNLKSVVGSFREGMTSGRSFAKFKDAAKEAYGSEAIGEVVKQLQERFGDDPRDMTPEQRKEATAYLFSKLAEAREDD